MLCLLRVTNGIAQPIFHHNGREYDGPIRFDFEATVGKNTVAGSHFSDINVTYAIERLQNSNLHPYQSDIDFNSFNTGCHSPK
jgi:hypothetical protein